ncbi:MAG: hypothetical protein M1837_003662 [Sclerophora amabilis]|nr:MAG: hypothetical protein M1837_003662 [Sclerophora amabilis]
MILTAAGSIAFFLALALADEPGTALQPGTGSPTGYQTGQCWRMDDNSAQRLTVFDPDKTRNCCSSQRVAGAEGQPDSVQFFGRIGDDLERVMQCSIPGDKTDRLNIEAFVSCCDAKYGAPQKDVFYGKCCGGKRESTDLDSVQKAKEVWDKEDVCVTTQADIDKARGEGPWQDFILETLNLEGPFPKKQPKVVHDAVLLERFDCPGVPQRMFSGAWFWQGTDTELHSDGFDGPWLGMKNPWDKEIPPTFVNKGDTEARIDAQDILPPEEFSV